VAMNSRWMFKGIAGLLPFVLLCSFLVACEDKDVRGQKCNSSEDCGEETDECYTPSDKVICLRTAYCWGQTGTCVPYCGSCDICPGCGVYGGDTIDCSPNNDDCRDDEVCTGLRWKTCFPKEAVQ